MASDLGGVRDTALIADSTVPPIWVAGTARAVEAAAAVLGSARRLVSLAPGNPRPRPDPGAVSQLRPRLLCRGWRARRLFPVKHLSARAQTRLAGDPG